MIHVTLRLYAELNDFIPREWRHRPFTCRVHPRTTVKDLIESAGVPHTEIDLILVNGESVDFNHVAGDWDRISVYPVFESIDISPLVRVRPAPLREPRFVLDTHLGKLARYLRILGFDTLYRNDYDDDELAGISADERRILLTQDSGLLKRRIVTHGYYVRERAPVRQVVEVLRRFDLAGLVEPFRRCPRCNTLLAPVAKEAILDRLQPRTRAHYEEFWICGTCGRVYWHGSHHQRMQDLIARILREVALGQ